MRHGSYGSCAEIKLTGHVPHLCTKCNKNVDQLAVEGQINADNSPCRHMNEISNDKSPRKDKIGRNSHRGTTDRNRGDSGNTHNCVTRIVDRDETQTRLTKEGLRVCWIRRYNEQRTAPDCV